MSKIYKGSTKPSYLRNGQDKKLKAQIPFMYKNFILRDKPWNKNLEFT